MSHIDFPKYFTVGTDDGKVPTLLPLAFTCSSSATSSSLVKSNTLSTPYLPLPSVPPLTEKVHSKQCAGVSAAYNKDNDVKLDSVTEKEALERARACGHCSK